MNAIDPGLARDVMLQIGAERPADDHREFRHDRVGHRVHHLGPVLGYAAPFVLTAHHEAGDVLQEHQGHAPDVAQLDEMRGLQG